MSKLNHLFVGISIISSLICCTEGEKNYETIDSKNKIELRDIKLREYKKEGHSSELVAERLVYNKDKSEISVSRGYFLSYINSVELIDSFKLLFEEGTYKVKDGKLTLKLDEGIVLDKEIKIMVRKIEYDLIKDKLEAEGEVKVIGKNFEFKGRGFSGNIRRNDYTFDNGISATLFK
ncbi:MAG: LPS export ABC transporter periplasmic protein LptC [Deltaproteobacteria bacterium]|nr:LPS export ABC transporter periplasmic protein LptC [Deltaproteobacteria bacterium]